MDGVPNLDASIEASLESSIDIVSEQLKVMGVYLARPIVQRQLLLLLLILLVAWAVPIGLRYWMKRHRPADGADRLWRRWIGAFSLVLAPLMALVFIQIFSVWFDAIGAPNGILIESRTILWVWLAYRVLLMLLYGRYGAAFAPFHYRIFLPIFFLLLGIRISRNFVNIRILSEFPLFTIADTTVTVERLFTAAAVIYGSVVASWAISRGIRRAMADRSDVEIGVVESIVTISRYVIVGIGLLVALYLLGVNMATLALIGGGLSIGVGFGLQHIVANFISGLVLLFEQSVVPGDVIAIDGQIGIVDHVNIRATTVRTLDNIEVLVPNETFITTEVTTLDQDEPRNPSALARGA